MIVPDPRSLSMAPGLTGATGGCVAQARAVSTPGPGPATAPALCLGAETVRGRRPTKVRSEE